MTVLVFGASGLLGSNVVTTARARGRSVVGTYHTNRPTLDITCEECDLGEFDAIRAVLERHDPELVVNCAALTDVDACEDSPALARRLNAEAPAEIAEWCGEHGVDLVHVSTDYVFSGDHHRPYTVTDDPAPVQTYGQTKLDGERAVRGAMADPLVIRPSFIYGIDRSTDELAGFPAWVRSEYRAGSDLPLYTDQQITPARAGQIATTLLDLVTSGAGDVFHVACRDCLTPHEFGRLIAERVDGSGTISSASLTDSQREATRPVDTCLDVSAVERTLERPQPTIHEDLGAIADRF